MCVGCNHPTPVEVYEKAIEWQAMKRRVGISISLEDARCEVMRSVVDPDGGINDRSKKLVAQMEPKPRQRQAHLKGNGFSPRPRVVNALGHWKVGGQDRACPPERD